MILAGDLARLMTESRFHLCGVQATRWQAVVFFSSPGWGGQNATFGFSTENSDMARSAIRGAAAIALCMLACGGPSAFGQAVSLEALYQPDTGNITMQAFNLDRSPGTLQIGTFQFLSPAQLLSGSVAAIPANAVSFATVRNSDASTFFEPPRTAAEIYATNFAGPNALFQSTWNLGNVAALGLTQSQIDSGFTTDPSVTPGGQPLAGRFLYQIQGESAFHAGRVRVVPEPSSLAVVAVAGLLSAAGLPRLRRRRRQPADQPGRGRA